MARTTLPKDVTDLLAAIERVLAEISNEFGVPLKLARSGAGPKPVRARRERPVPAHVPEAPDPESIVVDVGLGTLAFGGQTACAARAQARFLSPVIDAEGEVAPLGVIAGNIWSGYPPANSDELLAAIALSLVAICAGVGLELVEHPGEGFAIGKLPAMREAA